MYPQKDLSSILASFDSSVDDKENNIILQADEGMPFE